MKISFCKVGFDELCSPLCFRIEAENLEKKCTQEKGDFIINIASQKYISIYLYIYIWRNETESNWSSNNQSGFFLFVFGFISPLPKTSNEVLNIFNDDYTNEVQAGSVPYGMRP